MVVGGRSRKRAPLHGLGLKSGATWLAFAKSKKSPRDIPAYPRDIYAHDGWAGISDWLGTEREWRQRGLKHKSHTEGHANSSIRPTGAVIRVCAERC